MPIVTDWLKRLVASPLRTGRDAPPAPAASAFRREALAWQDGRRVAQDVHPFTVAVMGWWLGSPGVQRTPVDGLTAAYIRECTLQRDRNDPSWHARTMRAREYCRCGTPTTVDRCAYCTNCQLAFASCCLQDEPLAEWDNGNPICPTCQEGELVR